MFKLSILLLLALPVNASSLRETTIERQLAKSDGIFLGHFLKKKIIQIEDGSSAVQMVFKMKKETGFQSDFLGMEEVFIHFPHNRPEVVPHFVSGEQVVILAENINNRFWGLNHGVGTYKVVRYGSDSIMVNSVFPKSPKMGQIKWEKFEKVVREVKGISLKQVATLPVELPTRGRVPASVIEQGPYPVEQQTEPTGLQTIWLLFGFMLLGAWFRLSHRFR